MQDSFEYKEALEQLSRELLCSICLSIFRNPHNLTCNHIFCLKCIKLSLKTKSQCPLCKKAVTKRSLSANVQFKNIVKLYYGLDPNAEEEVDDDQENEEIVDALRTNTPSNSDNEDDIDQDAEYIPHLQSGRAKTKSNELIESPKRKPRSPRKLYSTVRGASANVSLKDLVLSNVLSSGQELQYKGEIGILQYDGKIHYEGEDYTSLSTWSTIVGHKKGLSANTKKNGWDCVTANGKLLKYYRDQYDQKASFYPNLDSKPEKEEEQEEDELDLPNIQREKPSLKRQLLFVENTSDEEENPKKLKNSVEEIICSSPESPIRSSSPEDSIVILPSPHTKMINSMKRSLDRHQSSIDELEKLMNTHEVISLIEEEDNLIEHKTCAVKPIYNIKDIVILGTGLSSNMVQQLYLAADKLGAKIVSEFSAEVSHIVTCVDSKNCTKRTMKYFFGLLNRKWIVSFNWILQSISEKKWVNEQEFEVTGDTFTVGAPLHFRTQNSNIFGGQSLFFKGLFLPPSPSRVELESLCKLAGGIVLNDLPHFPKVTQDLLMPSFHVICDSSWCTQDQAKAIVYACGYIPVSINWILDSLSSYKLLPQNRYYLYVQEENQELSQDY